MDKPNIFYFPKKHGLELVGVIDFSNEDNFYYYTAVWRSISGTLYYGDDIDCHCCRDPFDRVTSPRNLNKADDLNKIRRHLERRFREEAPRFDRDRRDKLAEEIVELMAKLIRYRLQSISDLIV